MSEPVSTEEHLALIDRRLERIEAFMVKVEDLWDKYGGLLNKHPAATSVLAKFGRR